MAKRHYIIYCDESDKKGRYFSNFYGGALINARDQEVITRLLDEKKVKLGLTSEIKWQRVTSQYLDLYAEFIRYYFEFVSTGRIKIRIMFKQNIHRPVGLSREHRENEYFFLYYQFLKHAFGIKYSNPNLIDKVYFSVLPDQIPDTHEKVSRFKDFVSMIPHRRSMSAYNVFMPRDQITDVDSKKHAIMQGLDVILGAMASKLNGKLLEKPEGSRVRGKRTIAKEKLYKHINKEIRNIYPNFNVGVSTGQANGPTDKWTHPYRHWNFVSRTSVLDSSLGRKGLAPLEPTE